EGVELVDLLGEVATPRVHLVARARIRVEVGVDVPAALRDFPYPLEALVQPLPEVRFGVRASWETAGDPHDGDRLVAAAFAPPLCGAVPLVRRRGGAHEMA